jgi:hypothetical protein
VAAKNPISITAQVLTSVETRALARAWSSHKRSGLCSKGRPAMLLLVLPPRQGASGRSRTGLVMTRVASPCPTRVELSGRAVSSSFGRYASTTRSSECQVRRTSE